MSDQFRIYMLGHRMGGNMLQFDKQVEQFWSSFFLLRDSKNISNESGKSELFGNCYHVGHLFPIIERFMFFFCEFDIFIGKVL